MGVILGIDTGGTFTDGVVLDYHTKEVLSSAKAFTTRENLTIGIENCIDKLSFDPGDVCMVSLSTTLATNAVVEGKYMPTGLITIGDKRKEKYPATVTVNVRGKQDVMGRELQPMYDLGCMPSTKEYMQAVRKLCDAEGILLIYDEVITGLRFRPGSAQMYYGVKPDLSTFAKAVANGFSLAVIAGKAEIMDHLNPLGPVTVSGTASGNFLSVLAAKECLKMASAPGFYDEIEKRERFFGDGVNDLFRKHGIPGHIRTMGAQFGLYFGYDDPAIDYDLGKSVTNFNPDMYPKFVEGALEEGLYFFCGGAYPIPHHNGFTSMHSMDDLAEALEKIDRVFSKIK